MTQHPETLSVIIPAYQEELNIPYIDKELFEVLDGLDLSYEVVFVNDGSTDRTEEKIEELKAARSHIKLVNHRRNLGLGAAIKTGIANSTGRLAVILDSDLTFHPRFIPVLLTRFAQGGVDCVIGSPGIKGEFARSIPYYRVLLSRGANRLYSLILGERITAISPIFRVYKTEQLTELDLESDRFEINAEILAKLLMKKRKVVEVPVPLEQRKYGESKLKSSREIPNHLRLMGKIIKWRLKG